MSRDLILSAGRGFGANVEILGVQQMGIIQEPLIRTCFHPPSDPCPSPDEAAPPLRSVPAELLAEHEAVLPSVLVHRDGIVRVMIDSPIGPYPFPAWVRYLGGPDICRGWFMKLVRPGGRVEVPQGG